MNDRTVPAWLALACALFGPVLLAAPTHSPQQGHAEPAEAGVEALSPPLREALVAEMQAVQAGMMSIIPALAAGHWKEVAAIAASIRDSYIMKQSLSPTQLEELHHALPVEFQALDAQFHAYAGMLSHAAEAGKPELMAFYHSRMLETCVACHADHARAKFPELAGHAAEADHAH
jgi:hypothetical protein